MKILFVNKFFYLKGGSERIFFDTAQLLESKGHRVAFFSMADRRNLPSFCEKYFVPNVDYEKVSVIDRIRVGGRFLYSLAAKRKIEELINDEKPDIAHLHNIHHQISPSIIHSLKKNNIPVVMTLHDYKMACASYSMVAHGTICEACKGKKYYQCILKTCFKDSVAKSLLGTIEMYLHQDMLHIYELVDIFISPSVFLKDKLKEMGFRGKIIYMPNFLCPEEFTPAFGWKENAIIYVGRLSEEKGLPTLIEAMKGLNNITLKVVGDGPMRVSLESKASKLGNIHFLGYKNNEELKDLIRQSMFMVMPSEWYENNPRSIIESFALGKPVIGSRIGGVPELVKDGETGLTFKAGSAEDLKTKIQYLLSHPNEIAAMGRNARILVERRLNSEMHYKGLMEIYGSLLKMSRQ